MDFVWGCCGLVFCFVLFFVAPPLPSKASESWKKAEAWNQRLCAWAELNQANIVVIICAVTDQLGRVQGTAQCLWPSSFLEQCKPPPGRQSETGAFLSKLTFSLAWSIS